jgi:phosphoribosylanthranilate isomerase
MVETAEKVNGFMASPVAQGRMPPDDIVIDRTRDRDKMIIQVYEIQTAAEAQAMIELGVDHIGSVVLSREEWKNADLKAAIDLVGDAGRKSSLIPLFTDEALISHCIEYYRPRILHFCETLEIPGAKDPIEVNGILDRQASIRERYPEVELMRSIPVGGNGNSHQLRSIELATTFATCSDWLLIDTFLLDEADNSQPVQGYVGITGRTCDWKLAKSVVDAVDTPVILAGGLGPQNTYDAVLEVGPAGIDSCTNTNATDENGRPIRFKKEPEKVAAMISEARRALKTLS